MTFFANMRQKLTPSILVGTTLAVGMSASAGSPTDTSNANGSYSISSLALGTNAITASKAIGASESGSVVGGADAIATLKISLGMNPNLDEIGRAHV